MLITIEQCVACVLNPSALDGALDSRQKAPVFSNTYKKAVNDECVVHIGRKLIFLLEPCGKKDNIIS